MTPTPSAEADDLLTKEMSLHDEKPLASVMAAYPSGVVGLRKLERQPGPDEVQKQFLLDHGAEPGQARRAHPPQRPTGVGEQGMRKRDLVSPDDWDALALTFSRAVEGAVPNRPDNEEEVHR